MGCRARAFTRRRPVPSDLDGALDDLRRGWVGRCRLREVEQKGFEVAGDVPFGERARAAPIGESMPAAVVGSSRTATILPWAAPATRAAYGSGGGFFVAVKPCGRSAPGPLRGPARTDALRHRLEWIVTDQVKAMYTGANHGFLIRDANEGPGNAAQSFKSREGSGGRRPQLVVTFGPA